LRLTLVLLIAGLTTGWPIGAAVQTRTVASLWYRGLPAGVPRQVDLDAIRAAGLTAVTWPLQHGAGALELRRMADRASLKVVIRTESVPLTPVSALTPDTHVDIAAARAPVALLPALAWRAIAHGARVVSFDADLSGAIGAAVSAVARQIAINATLVDTLSAGPAVRVDPQVGNLDVALLEGPRSWVLVATNTAAAGTAPADAYAFMPSGVPSAEWLNLFDGSTIGMSSRPTGARWHIVLGAGDARVYVIDKVLK
jgi:hypothetical protein